jgi:hypothetical protein
MYEDMARPTPEASQAAFRQMERDYRQATDTGATSMAYRAGDNGPFGAALRAASGNRQQALAIYGAWRAQGAIGVDANGLPVVKDGQNLPWVNTDRLNSAQLNGLAQFGAKNLGAESATRATIKAELADAAMRATNASEVQRLVNRSAVSQSQGMVAAGVEKPVWSFRQAVLDQRRYEATHAAPSSFSYGFNLGDRSVLDGVEVTAGEKVGRALGETWSGFKQGSINLYSTMTGLNSFNQAGANLRAGNLWAAGAYTVVGATEAAATLLTFGTGGATRATAQTAQELAAARATYLGDVYSPHFVGPVQWKYFYRGDATARTEFMSSMAQERGVPAATEFLNSRATEPLSNIYAQHGIGSQGLPTIGVSDNPLVAQYFARGPSQTQNGFMTTFRIEAREAERLAIPNWDNPMSFMELNPYIGLPEREFLFHIQIDPKYVIKQVPVEPR